MKNLMKPLGLVFFLFSAQAHAEMVVNVGLASFGGNDFIVETDKTLEAGAGLFASIGLAHQKGGSPWSYQAMLGIKVNGADFTGGKATLRAYPVHLMAFYKHKNFRYGTGLTYDFAIELDVTGDNPRTVNFKNAPGLVLEMNHLLTERWYWGIRYTDMNYKEKETGVKSNASNLAGFAGMFF